MSLVLSTMLPLGTVAPDFTLPDVISGQTFTLKNNPPEKGIVVVFICNHCPYVKHIIKKLVDVADTYTPKGIRFVAISANDARQYSDDAPDKMRVFANDYGFSFPYLYDETQDIAKAYQAACTPDFYLFDKNFHCVYRGRFDDATPGNQAPVTGKDLSEAMDNLLTGNAITSDQKPSMGCNIKWK